MISKLRVCLVFLLSGILGACVAPAPPDITGAGSQLAIREAQTREYDTLDKAMTMRMTVTVREKGTKQIAVRANARIGEENVTNPATYQDFFSDLDKAMFLTLNKVD